MTAAVVEHLQLANWIIEKGEPARDGTGYTPDRKIRGS
jgi:hypothetical protein